MSDEISLDPERKLRGDRVLMWLRGTIDDENMKVIMEYRKEETQQ